MRGSDYTSASVHSSVAGSPGWPCSRAWVAAKEARKSSSPVVVLVSVVDGAWGNATVTPLPPPLFLPPLLPH